ncbi:MAG: hypothetical protein ACRD8Z_01045, partial [Nitrososphaeraceae archaeon]
KVGTIKYNSIIMAGKSIRFLIITSTLDNSFIIYKLIIVSFFIGSRAGSSTDVTLISGVEF